VLKGIRVFILLGLLSSFLMVSSSLAGETNLPVLNTEVKAVAIFKNGLGFFVREGEVRLRDGWAVTEYVPNATLGSVWIGTLDKNVNLEEAIGFKEEINKETETISIEELLKANVGKKVVITFGDKTIEGRIKSVPENRTPEEDTIRYNYRRSYTPSYRQPKLATMVILQTKNGEVALNKNRISEIEFPARCSTKFISREKAKRIKFKIATRKKKARLSLAYLEKGISWIPSYLINIEEPEKARITMKATIINDIEDLKNVDVFFVVGYPNFTYADILSPMALEETLTQFIAALGASGRRPREYNRLANVMSQSVSFARREERIPSLDYTYTAIKGLPGASEEDLFLYNKKGISLKKGERAYYHIFSDEVNYKHIYEWEIPDTIEVDMRGYYRTGQKKKEREQVWHSIKLTNSTAYPWTTAPALTVRGWKPIAQDIIEYTPKGAKTNLKLTVATDIKTDRHEYEIDRERDVRLYRRSYDLVTVKGELYIKNSKDKDVTMEVKKKLTGEVIEVSHQGKVEKIAEGLKGVNYKSVISWQIPLKAREEINITYKYKVYVTH